MQEIDFSCFCHSIDKEFENNKPIMTLQENQNNLYNYCYEKAYRSFVREIPENSGIIFIERRRPNESKLLEKTHKRLLKDEFMFEASIRNTSQKLFDKKLHQKGKVDNVNGLQFVDFFAGNLLVHWIKRHNKPLLDKQVDKMYMHEHIVEFLESKKIVGGYTLCYENTIRMVLGDSGENLMSSI